MDVHLELQLELAPVEFGPESLLMTYGGKVCRSEPYKPIGRVRAFVVPIERARERGYGALGLLDADSSVWPYQALFSRREAGFFTAAVNTALGIDKAVVLNQDLLIIDRIEILPGFRGRWYGLQAMHLLIAHLSLGCRLAAIRPFPLQFESGCPSGEDPAWRRRLQLERFVLPKAGATRLLCDHYAKLGFVAIRGTDLMALNLERGYLTDWDEVVGK